MGSKTPHTNQDQGYDEPIPNGSNTAGGRQRGCHVSQDGDGCMGSNGASNDSDDDDDNADKERATAVSIGDLSTSKTRKKKRSKKSKKKRPTQQSSPPRIALDVFFPSGEYPVGQLLEYGPESRARIQSSELTHNTHRAIEDENFLKNYRKAAEVHRQTRKWVQETIKPGQSLTDIAIGIEESVRALLDNQGLESGQSRQSGLGFPTGLSLNNCVAHYTPNPGQKDVVLQHEDVIKVDFGVHINGWIVDSAFTVAFDPIYDNLLAAVRDATNTGIKTAGVDVRISDVSAAIQEAMESYEVEIRGKTLPVKAVRNITGHDIKQYRIHGGKSIPFVKNSDQTKMEAGEVFAIETFGTTGRGWVKDGPGIYGYGLDHNAPAKVALPLASANRLYKTIRDNFGTIVFCRRYLERLGVDRYLAGVNSLVSNGILESYAPLMDISGSYSAQFEHTILLREGAKEVISRGDDY